MLGTNRFTPKLMSPGAGRQDVPGLAVAFAIAVLSTALARFVPLLGPAVIAILLGIVVRQAMGLPRSLEPGVRLASKRVLQLAIVLLGTGLSLSQVWTTGRSSLPVMLGTLVVGVGLMLVLGCCPLPGHWTYPSPLTAWLRALGWDGNQRHVVRRRRGLFVRDRRRLLRSDREVEPHDHDRAGRAPLCSCRIPREAGHRSPFSPELPPRFPALHCVVSCRQCPEHHRCLPAHRRTHVTNRRSIPHSSGSGRRRALIRSPRDGKNGASARIAWFTGMGISSRSQPAIPTCFRPNVAR